MQFAHGRIASVVAGTSVLVLLGGVGGAVAANTVGSQDIRNNSIRQVDVQNGGLGFRDFNNWTQNRIDAANRGQRGPEGEPGAPGAPGKDGVSGAVTEKPSAEVVDIAPGTTGTATAVCPDGKAAIGGGYEVEGLGTNNDKNPGDISALRNQPDGTYADGMFSAWQVVVHNGSSAMISLQPAVICADVS
jgi:hypothetical protein